VEGHRLRYSHRCGRDRVPAGRVGSIRSQRRSLSQRWAGTAGASPTLDRVRRLGVRAGRQIDLIGEPRPHAGEYGYIQLSQSPVLGIRRRQSERGGLRESHGLLVISGIDSRSQRPLDRFNSTIDNVASNAPSLGLHVGRVWYKRPMSSTKSSRLQVPAGRRGRSVARRQVEITEHATTTTSMVRIADSSEGVLKATSDIATSARSQYQRPESTTVTDVPLTLSPVWLAVAKVIAEIAAISGVRPR
jgi:hypothetical protein